MKITGLHSPVFLSNFSQSYFLTLGRKAASAAFMVLSIGILVHPTCGRLNVARMAAGGLTAYTK